MANSEERPSELQRLSSHAAGPHLHEEHGTPHAPETGRGRTYLLGIRSEASGAARAETEFSLHAPMGPPSPCSLPPLRLLPRSPQATMSGAFVTVVKVLASLSALYMCLSPSTSIYRVHKLRSTGAASIVPLVALWGCNHMWLLYGYVTDDIFPLMITYIVGDVTSVVFISVFYRYTPAKRLARQVCIGTLLLNAVVTVYAVLGKTGKLHQREHDVKLIVGIIAIASSIVLYSSPFATISHVVRSKSSESIPFAMVMVGIVNNALWIVYGLLIHDALLVIPTAVNVVIGAIQFVLYFVYHPKRQKPGTAVINGATVSVGGVGGAIEIITEAPRLTHPQSRAPGQGADNLTLSSIQIEAEPVYIEVQTPSRHGHLASTSGFSTK